MEAAAPVSRAWRYGVTTALVALVVVASWHLGIPWGDPADAVTVRSVAVRGAVLAAVAAGFALVGASLLADMGARRGELATIALGAGALGILFGFLARAELLTPLDSSIVTMLAFMTMGLYAMFLIVFPGNVGAVVIIGGIVCVTLAATTEAPRRRLRLLQTCVGVGTFFALALALFATFIITSEPVVVEAMDRRRIVHPALLAIGALVGAAWLARRRT